MARYDYRCTACGEVFEVEHAMTEHPEVSCPKCGAKAEKVSPRAASSSQEAASTTPISAEGAPRRKRPLDRATAAHLQIPALLPARRIPARTARTKTRRRTNPIRPATCAGSRVCGSALSFANPNGSDEPASAPDVSPACENRSTCIRRGPHAWQRLVACTATPGRLHGPAKAISTFGHFSGILESITQKTERKHQIDCLPFRTFALDTQQPRNQVPKS